MGNTTNSTKPNILFVESIFVAKLQPQIVALLSDCYTIHFRDLDDLEQLPSTELVQMHFVAECVYKEPLQAKLKEIGCLGASTPQLSIVKTTTEPERYMEQLAVLLALRNGTGPSEPATAACRHVLVKFVDKNVRSPHYQLFLNYMKNRQVSYELHTTISDFLQSEKKSHCSYVIASADYAQFMFSNYPNVYCFCNRSQEFQGKISRLSVQECKERSYESNFTKIIKQIISHRKKTNKQTTTVPVRVLLIWKQGFDEQTFSELIRRKVQCRVIVVEQLQELVALARKSLYTTIVLHSQREWREFEDASYVSHLDGRVKVFSCVRGRHQLFKSLDAHLQLGYQVTTRKVRSVAFLGDTPYLDKMRHLQHLLFAEGVRSELLELQKFLVNPYQCPVIVAPVQLQQRVSAQLKKLSFTTVVLSLNLQGPSKTDEQRDLQHRKNVTRILKELEGKVAYIEGGGYVYPRLQGILRDLSDAQNNEHFFLEVEDSGTSSMNLQASINYTAKFTLAEKDNLPLFESVARMWQLGYCATDNYRILQQDIIDSLQHFHKLKLLRLKQDHLEHLIAQLTKCGSFVSVVSAMWHSYLAQSDIRSFLKLLMAGIDKYSDHERIELLKPIVFSLMCSTCGVFNPPAVQPVKAVLRLDRCRLLGLKKDSRLITHQFIEAELNCQGMTGELLEIVYCPTKQNNQFYPGVRIDKGRMVLCPHTSLRVIGINTEQAGVMVKVEVQTAQPMRSIIERNTQIAGQSSMDYFGKHRQFATQEQQLAVRERMVLYKFLSEIRENKFFRASCWLELYMKQWDDLDEELVNSARLYLSFKSGQFAEGRRILEEIGHHPRMDYWAAKWDIIFAQSESKMLTKQPQRPHQLPVKWTVRFSEKLDSFELEHQSTGQSHHYASDMALDELPAQTEVKLLPPKKKTRVFAYSANANLLRLEVLPPIKQHFKSTLSTCFERPDSLLMQPMDEMNQQQQCLSSSQEKYSCSNNSMLKMTDENMAPPTELQFAVSCPLEPISNPTTTKTLPRKRHKITRSIYRLL